MSVASTQSWALLVGINYYVKDKCLGGCVRDVQSIAKYLDALEKGIKIITLTASSPSVTDSYYPSEDASSWPTLKNVTSALKKIINETCSGDAVYIHYSGHGTRIKMPKEKQNSKVPKLAFVLYEPSAPYQSYFRGTSMCKAIQQLVKKGVHVTLVLDCCFSGSMQRGSHRTQETMARTVEYINDDDSPQEDDFEALEELNGGTYRDSRIVPKWLVDPDGYVVLTACGPHEIAEELKLEKEQRAGALSYFLLESLHTLRGHHSQITPHSLYQHLRTRFHVEWPKQVPMRYGKHDFPIFGVNHLDKVPDLVPVFSEEDVLYLGAGQAHGVREGDEYITYPFEAPENDHVRAIRESGIAKVTKVHALVSEFEVTKHPSTSGLIRKAKLVSQLTPWSVPVRIKGPKTIAEDSLLWSTTADSFFHITSKEENSYLYSIESNAKDELVIKNASGDKIPMIPNIPLSDTNALQQALGIVDHLAQFKYLQSIHNRTPDPDFGSCFTITSHQPPQEDGFVEIKHGEDWSFKVQNLSSKALYITVFDFTESWQVFNMISESGEGEFMVLPPKSEDGEGEEEIDLTMKVPQRLLDHGQNHCEDVIKFFVTSKETSFASIRLPPVVGVKTRSKKRTPGRKVFLRELMLSLTHGYRGSTNHYWATQDFLIRTTIDIEKV